ncbi:P-loop containing nucleoside triphosphate hydrolase protein [Xylariales sp. PMI_506]|nr:P-loop containing nucleoside triphosphate hydrolase protein [Xylariales sp. PMI_506]
MSTVGWGPEAPKQADAGTWGNGTEPNMAQAAVDHEEPKPTAPDLPFESRDAPVVPWAATTKYDYEVYNANTSGAGNWEGNSAVYQWDGEEGDIGPEHPELEKILFGEPQDRDPQGPDFSKIDQIDVLQEGLTRINPITSFHNAGLHPIMKRNIVLCGYKTPTPIQRYCIPAVKMGHDMIAIAQTGSGKTAAYLVPVLNNLMGKAKKLAAYRPNPSDVDASIADPVTAEPLVLIVCPARELAVQIFNETRKFCYRSMLRPTVLYGGGPMRDQIKQLGYGSDVVISTPGRLVDMLDRPHLLSLRRLKYMIIDEADEMLHADWEEEFTKILSGGEQDEASVQYLLFSATFPTAVRQLAKCHLSETHVRVRVGRVGSTHENINQQVIWVHPFMKKVALKDLIFSLDPGRTIVFVNNKRTADELDDYLFNSGLPCTSMHSDRTQREREDSMRAFRTGTTPILVATGVSARGLDIRNVKFVINYDLPNMDHGGLVEYTHRIGRTARIGHTGVAYSFYDPQRDEAMAESLAKLLLEAKQEIPAFFKQYIPEGTDANNIKFEPDSDEEIETNDAGNDDGGAWGGDTGTGSGSGSWGENTGTATQEPVSVGDNWGSGDAVGTAPAW